MAHPTAAWNEQHSYRCNARDEERIMVGATYHFLVGLSCCESRFLQCRQDRRVAGRRRICVYQVGGDGYAASGCDMGTLGAEGVEHAITPCAVDVANVGFKAHTRRDAVDCAGEDLANAYRPH